MANLEHLKLLEEGVEAWNAWRAADDSLRPDLRSSDLHQMRLSGCNLASADLSGASLFRVDLSGAILNRALLRGADLTGTIFRESDLGEADFTDAILGHTVFAEVNLATVKGLETVKHIGPSSVGIETLDKSRGAVPDLFLRGAGLPENFIAYARSLIAAPISFYSCFISYSTKDQDFADRLFADLQLRGIRCWFAPHDIQAGRKIHEQIDESIRTYDRLLLVLSEHNMSSNWVQTEIAMALRKERRGNRQTLFPVSLVPSDRVRQRMHSGDLCAGSGVREIAPSPFRLA